MSPTEGKPANYVPKYLIEKGYNVIPVNPIYDSILGLKSYPKVSEIPHAVDIVDIFRKSEDILPIAKDMVHKKEIKVLTFRLDKQKAMSTNSGISNSNSQMQVTE